MGALIIDAIPLALLVSTPLLLAVIGELCVQRGGMINLGLEGMMLTAAITAVIATQCSGSVVAGFAGGIAGAAAIALLFTLFTVVLGGDQIVTGTALNLLALGATSFIYRELTTLFTAPLPRPETDFVLPFAWIGIPVVVAVVLWNTSFGLRLRACGANAEAVAAAGASVRLYRSFALAIEAVLAGVAGAYLSLVLSSGFAENMTAGRGYIALAIVIFGRWKIKGALIGTAIFSLAAALQYGIQASGAGLPFHLLLASPYVLTIAVLAMFGVRRQS